MLGLDSGKLLAKSSGWLYESHRAATTLVLEYQSVRPRLSSSTRQRVGALSPRPREPQRVSEQGAEAPHSGAPKLTRIWPPYFHSTGGETEAQQGAIQETAWIRLPARLRAPACTGLHTPRCVRPGASAPRIQEAGWRGQAWPGARRLDAGPARAHAYSDAHSGLRGPSSLARGTEVESTPYPPASHYVPHNAWVPLITARRPTPGRASFHSGPQPQPLISAWGHPIPLPQSRAGSIAARSSPRPPSRSLRPPVPAGRDAARRSRSDFHRGPTLCLRAPHLSARQPSPPHRPAWTYLVAAATAAEAAVTPS